VSRAYGWDPVGGQSYTLDGGLLFVTVMTGVVGLSLYLLMLGFVVRRCRRVWRDASASAQARGTALGAAAGTAALVVHSLFVNSLLLPFIMQPLWILWGIVFLHRRSALRRVAVGERPRGSGPGARPRRRPPPRRSPPARPRASRARTWAAAGAPRAPS
jgi:hypothetical protein